MKKSKSILICLVFSFLYTAILWFVVTLPFNKFKNAIDTLPQMVNSSLIDRFPDDLVISIKKGVVSINKPSPYCFVIDDKSKIGVVFDSSIMSANPNAFDPNGPYQELCKPIAVVSQTFIMNMDTDSGQIKINKIPTDISYEVDKKIVSSFVENILPTIINIGNVSYFVVPLVIFLFFFIFTLSSNVWYSIIARFFLKTFKINTNPPKSLVYGTSLFTLNILQFINLVLFSWFINKAFKQDYSLSFFFSKTIITTLGVIVYFKFLRPSNTPTPPTLSSTKSPPLVSDFPSQPDSKPITNPPSQTSPQQNVSPSLHVPDLTNPTPPKSIHVDLTSPSQSPPDSDPNPTPQAK